MPAPASAVTVFLAISACICWTLPCICLACCIRSPRFMFLSESNIASLQQIRGVLRSRLGGRLYPGGRGVPSPCGKSLLWCGDFREFGAILLIEGQVLRVAAG